MSLARRLKIMVLKYDVSSQKEQKPYPLEGDAENPFFVTRRLAADGFLALKAHAKSRGASVNDMFLTAYIRALHLRTGEERIVMPCPVDLRRFIPQGRSHGICNLTSNLICDVRVGGGDTFDETLSQVSGQMRLRKESLSSLKSVVLLGLIVHLVPFQLLRRIFGRLFTIPVVSYTNLGVIDSGRLHFGGVGVTDAFLTGAVKYVPYFQLAFSTFGDVCTLSCNLHGTPEDRETIGLFLESLCGELAF
jgi:NRPS condensation-like uncharacterized protein